MRSHRSVAQLGSAPGLGPGCRRFKSCRSDQISNLTRPGAARQGKDNKFIITQNIVGDKNERS